MKFYAITLKPVSGFGTLLKGDTIFGHFCWQAAYDASLIVGGLEEQIALYPEKPFAIFSSAFLKSMTENQNVYFLKRPDLPFSFLIPRQKDRLAGLRLKKEHKKKKWMMVDEALRLDIKKAEFFSDHELLEQTFKHLTYGSRRQFLKTDAHELVKASPQTHNSINRLTQSTGTGPFAPYVKQNFFYLPETELVVFVLIEESATDISRVTCGMERIGVWGYGKDASTGMGRFEVCETNELPLPALKGVTALYALAPCVPEKYTFRDVFFTPFTRFGKHGDRLACHGNPFKNPVIMADEGAVLIPKDIATVQKPYVGQGILNVSKAMSKTVVQGYAPCLPLEMEMLYETNL